jgi:hypothetical protein
VDASRMMATTACMEKKEKGCQSRKEKKRVTGTILGKPSNPCNTPSSTQLYPRPEFFTRVGTTKFSGYGFWGGT